MPGSYSVPPLRFSRRKFLIGTGAAAAGLALYSGEVARHEISFDTRTIPITNLPTPFQGYRIVQISDIHLDEFTEPYFLERIVHDVNALNPHLVLLTGDFVTRGAFTFVDARSSAYRCSEILSTLTAPLRYGILGNHDVTVGAPLVIEALTSYGTPVLVNQHVAIEQGGERIWLCGVDDPDTRRPNLDLAIPAKPNAPVILMAHEPDYADDVLQHPRAPLIDLMLSGHTHGGQIRLPFLGALVLPTLGRKYVEGLFHLKKMQLYVNRGIGTVGLPFRLNCPPEISVLTLQRA